MNRRVSRRAGTQDAKWGRANTGAEEVSRGQPEKKHTEIKASLLGNKGSGENFSQGVIWSNLHLRIITSSILERNTLRSREICSGANSAIRKDIIVAWVKEVGDSEDEIRGQFQRDFWDQMYKTWRLAKYRKGEKSHRRVLSSFWFGQWSGVCTLPTGHYWPLHHGLGWNLERVISGAGRWRKGVRIDHSAPLL